MDAFRIYRQPPPYFSYNRAINRGTGHNIMYKPELIDYDMNKVSLDIFSPEEEFYARVLDRYTRFYRKFRKEYADHHLRNEASDEINFVPEVDQKLEIIDDLFEDDDHQHHTL